MTPADVAACIAAIEIVEKEAERINPLWERAEYFKDGLNKLGFKRAKVRLRLPQ
jgi:glycine C-acetyltransferase